MRHAGKLRQQIFVGLANVSPAARIIERFGAANFGFHWSAWKLFPYNRLQIRNALHGNFRLIAQGETIDDVEVIVGRGDGLLASSHSGLFVGLGAQ